MTTYTDLIRKMDNPRYVGKIDKPVKRVNKVYDLFIDGSYIKTEYHKNNDQLAIGRLMDHVRYYINKMNRLGGDPAGEIEIRITDRDGKISFKKFSKNA